MKKIFKIMMIFALLISVVACSKNEDEPVVESPLSATYLNVAGIWKLKNWNNAPLADSLYCYIELKSKDRTFVTYDNLNSMYAHKLTGTYELKVDNNSVDVISGEYDYKWGSWNNEYEIVVYKEHMTWTVKGGTELSVYERCAEIPEDVKNGTSRSLSTQDLKKFL